MFYKKKDQNDKNHILIRLQRSSTRFKNSLTIKIISLIIRVRFYEFSRVCGLRDSRHMCKYLKQM